MLLYYKLLYILYYIICYYLVTNCYLLYYNITISYNVLLTKQIVGK